MSRNTLFLDGEVCFITTTTIEWIDIFTRPVYKHIIVDSLVHCQINKGLFIYGWCLMSNHIHIIASAKKGIALNDIIRDFKKYTSKRIARQILMGTESRKGWMLRAFRYHGSQHTKNIKNKIWQDGYHCFELYTANVYDQKLNYIHNNPVKAELVAEPHDYLYSSARNYADLPGLLDVIIQ